MTGGPRQFPLEPVGAAAAEELAGPVRWVANLVVVDSHPWLGDGDPDGWLDILDRLDELGIETLGPVGAAGHVGFVRTYVETLPELPDTRPPEYAGLDFADVYERNLAFLREHVQIRAD